MKLRIAAVVAAVGAVSLVIAFRIEDPTWIGFLVGLAGNMLSVALAIVLVNQYMEGDARKRAVRALLTLSEQSVAAFHNLWMELSWAKFGRDKYGECFAEYIKSNGNPEALREDVRRQIYNLYKANSELRSRIKNLDEALTELSRLAGWSLDPTILEECLKARISISRLLAVDLDDSPHSANQITEHLLDIDIHTGLARTSLMEIAGIKDNEE